jgi:hypothetical protein
MVRRLVVTYREQAFLSAATQRLIDLLMAQHDATPRARLDASSVP